MPFEQPASNGYVISDDPARLDLDCIHGWIANESYWAKGRSREITERSIAGSLCLAVYAPDGSQAGFARVVSDYATMAHLSDVFVLAAHRGHGLGKALVAATLGHPLLAGIPRWTLVTGDAHGLYAGFGFVLISNPEKQMIRQR